MAIAQNSQVTWADMRALFDRVNAERNRFGMSVVNSGNISAKGSTAYATVPNQLKNLIQEMTSNSFLATVASTSSISTATAGQTLITPSGLNSLSQILTNIENTKPTKTSGRDLTFTAYNFCARHLQGFESHNSRFGASGTQFARFAFGTTGTYHTTFGTKNVEFITCGTDCITGFIFGESFNSHRFTCSGYVHRGGVSNSRFYGTHYSDFGRFNGSHFSRFFTTHYSSFGRSNTTHHSSFTFYFGTHYSRFSFYYGTHYASFGRYNGTHYSAFGRVNTTHFFDFGRYNGSHFSGFRSGHNSTTGILRAAEFGTYNRTFFGTHYNRFTIGYGTHFSRFSFSFTTHHASFTRYNGTHHSAFTRYNGTHHSSFGFYYGTHYAQFTFGYTGTVHGIFFGTHHSAFLFHYTSFFGTHFSSFCSSHTVCATVCSSFSFTRNWDFCRTFHSRHGTGCVGGFTTNSQYLPEDNAFNSRHTRTGTDHRAYLPGCSSGFYASHKYGFDSFYSSHCASGFCPSSFCGASYFSTL